MWYTATLSLGIFLLWVASNAFYSLLIYAFAVPPYVLALPHYVLRRLYVPEGFILLIEYLPHVLFVIAYYALVNLPESRRFKHWSGWEWVRREWFMLRAPSVPWRPHVDHQVVYAIVPHSVYAEATTFCFLLNPLYEGVVIFATSLLFLIPFVRDLASLAGARPATSAAISSALDAGNSIIIMPQGMRGALHVNDGHAGIMRLFKQRPRKGFIKLAIASRNHKTLRIVPVYIKNADKTYTTYHVWPWAQEKLLDKFWYPWPLFNFGWYGSFWPKPCPLEVCFGQPIAVDGKEVDAVYAEFCASIDALGLYTGK